MSADAIGMFVPGAIAPATVPPVPAREIATPEVRTRVPRPVVDEAARSAEALLIREAQAGSRTAFDAGHPPGGFSQGVSLPGQFPF